MSDDSFFNIMAPKPQSKHFSFRRFLGRRIESANASSNPPRSEGVSSQSSSGSFSPAQVQPSTVVGVTGVAIVDEPPPPHSLDNPSFFANSSHFVVQNMKVVDASQHHASNSAGEGQASPSSKNQYKYSHQALYQAGNSFLRK